MGNRRVLTENLVTAPDQVIGAYLESGGLVVMEAEHFVISTTNASHQWQLQTGQSGYTGTGYLQPLPDIDALYQTTELANSPRVDYPIYFTTPGTYTLWLRGYPANAAGDSLHIGLNGVITTVTGFGPEEWGWSSETTNSQPFTVAITNAELYTVSLWLREDGLRIDQLALTTNTTYVPSGFLAETERLSAEELLAQAQLTRTIVYTYDDLYRLTQAEYTTGESYQYGYDEVGNRLQQIIDGDTTEYLYDEANRLEAVTHLSVTQPYTFSANGNLLNTGVMTNTFDGVNRLVSSNRSTATVQPVYNGVGDRVRQVVSGTTTYYTLDVEGLPEVITSAGEIYLHLPGVIVTEKAGQVRYLLGDGLGSIRQAIDGTGAVVAYNQYDPYGNPVQEGSQPYGFSGEWWQDEIDLLHLRARWYAPYLNQFISPDPIIPDYSRPQSLNQYAYALNNPINLKDPSGLLADPRYLSTIPSKYYGGWSEAENYGEIVARQAYLWGAAGAYSSIYAAQVYSWWLRGNPLNVPMSDIQQGSNIGAGILGVDTYFELSAFATKIWKANDQARQDCPPSDTLEIVWQFPNIHIWTLKHYGGAFVRGEIQSVNNIIAVWVIDMTMRYGDKLALPPKYDDVS